MNDKAHLEFFRSLIKDGCTWHGDIHSTLWAECLYFKDVEDVLDTLEGYTEGVDYLLEQGRVWIA